MVLWEITAVTAYFLGLKKTYKLALRIQRRVVGPQHPKIRAFLHRRTRSIFDMAISVHKTIQERDIEVGRNVGNWILRWLDRMKPSAEIRPRSQASSTNLHKHTAGTGLPPGIHRPNIKITDQQSNSRKLFTPLNIRAKSFPTISMMLQSRKPVGMSSQYRHLSHTASITPKLYSVNGHFESVFRKDIAQFMQRN